MDRANVRIPRIRVEPAGRGPRRSLLHELLVWQERANQRRRLRELPDHLLRDLDLSRADVEREAVKPFWTL